MRTVRCHCPHCHYVVDAATDAVGDEDPKPGDFTICFYCASVTIFDENLAIRKLTDEEAKAAAECKELQQIVKMLKKRLAYRNN